MLVAWEAMIGGSGTPFFPLDLLASGAVKRGVSASAAVKVLVESWNLVSARSLLRTDLDIALMLANTSFVENAHEFVVLTT
ncbi:hypothetical protein ABIB38_002279 [Massilia sp. UYP11]|uniref:hypothetical protein n=1 Tax=Massilia sp. UYP11 TaxID=1756385 RepID=UPI003D238474